MIVIEGCFSVAKKLTKISARTIDQKLRHQKELLRQLQRKGQPKQMSFEMHLKCRTLQHYINN